MAAPVCSWKIFQFVCNNSWYAELCLLWTVLLPVLCLRLLRLFLNETWPLWKQALWLNEFEQCTLNIQLCIFNTWMPWVLNWMRYILPIYVGTNIIYLFYDLHTIECITLMIHTTSICFKNTIKYKPTSKCSSNFEITHIIIL